MSRQHDRNYLGRMTQRILLADATFDLFYVITMLIPHHLSHDAILGPPPLTCSRKFPRILSLTCSAPSRAHRSLAPPPRSAPSLRPLAQAFFPLLDLLLAFAQLFINSRPTNKQLYDVVMVSGILNAYSISEWSTACARVKLIKRAAYSLIRVPIFPALKTPILRERRSSIHANE